MRNLGGPGELNSRHLQTRDKLQLNFWLFFFIYWSAYLNSVYFVLYGIFINALLSLLIIPLWRHIFRKLSQGLRCCVLKYLFFTVQQIYCFVIYSYNKNNYHQNFNLEDFWYCTLVLGSIKRKNKWTFEIHCFPVHECSLGVGLQRFSKTFHNGMEPISIVDRSSYGNYWQY